MAFPSKTSPPTGGGTLTAKPSQKRSALMSLKRMKHRSGRRSPTLLCWLILRLYRLGWLLRHGAPARRQKQRQSHDNRARGGVSRSAPTALNPFEFPQPVDGKLWPAHKLPKSKFAAGFGRLSSGPFHASRHFSGYAITTLKQSESIPTKSREEH